MSEETQKPDLLDIGHHILEDLHIDKDEVLMMQASIVEDGAIDQEEAEMLFAINDAISEGGTKCPEYDQFFIEAITAFLLADDISEGVLDDMEWDWLRAMIGEDGDLDDLEIKLLAHIAKVSTSVPSDFYDYAQRFEEVEYEDEDESRMTFLANYLSGALKGKVRGDAAETRHLQE